MSINRSRTLSFLVAIPIGAAFAMVPAGPALAASWSVVTTPAGTSLFFGVDATSTTNAWAVGRRLRLPTGPGDAHDQRLTTRSKILTTFRGTPA